MAVFPLFGGPYYSHGQQRNARIGEIVPYDKHFFPRYEMQTHHLRRGECMGWLVGAAALSTFRFGAHSGLKLDVARGLKSADSVARLNFRKTAKQAVTVDRCGLKRATEVASESGTE
jgi:hypothetical protein